MKQYPCVGTLLSGEHNGKTYYIPPIWVSKDEGIYHPRIMCDTAAEALEMAQKAVDKMIKVKNG